MEINGVHATSAPQAKSLHAMEELWQCLSKNQKQEIPQVEVDIDFIHELMAFSIQAMKGTEGSKTSRLRGHLKT